MLSLVIAVACWMQHYAVYDEDEAFKNAKLPRLRHIVAINPKQPPDGLMLPAMLWNDTRCRDLIGPTFDSITFGPYKSDLCRLHVLWHYGGVYTDDDIWLVKEPPRGLVVIRESGNFKANEDQIHYFNAFISVPGPHHPAMRATIKRSHARLKEALGHADKGTLNLWGPRMLHHSLKYYNHTLYQEVCSAGTACACFVPGLLYSHRPCNYGPFEYDPIL